MSLLAALFKKQRSKAITFFMVVGTLGTLWAAFSGWMSAQRWATDFVLYHRGLGVACAVLALASLWAYCRLTPASKPYRRVILLLLITLALLAILAGHAAEHMIHAEH